MFRKLYEQAEYARFTPNQQLTYERSLKYELDTYNQIEGGRILGHEEGLKEGREEGRKEGLLDVAKKLLSMGLDSKHTVKYTLWGL